MRFGTSRRSSRRACATAAAPSPSAVARSSQRQARVAGQRHLGARGAADLGRIDLDVDDGLAGRDQREALGGDLAELAADDEQAVATPRSARWRCGRSGRTGRPRADACRQSRPCPTWCARPGCRAPRPAPAARHRPREMWTPPPARISGRSALASSAAARSTSARSGRDAARLRLQRAGIDPEVGGVEIVLAVRDVLRHVDQHRARPAAGRDGEGAAHVLGDALDRPRRGSPP